MFLPAARREGLTVKQLATETLVYDYQTNKAHCLNGTAAFIWKLCDGATTVTEMARQMRRDLGIDPSEPVVQLALEQLSRRKLLAQPAPALTEPARLARRALLKKLAAAAALPLVLSVTANRAHASGTPPVATYDIAPGTCTCLCIGNAAAVQANFCQTKTATCGGGRTCTNNKGNPTCTCV